QTTSTVVDAHGRTVKVWNADNLVTFSDAKGTTSTAPSVSFKLDGFGRMRETDLKDQAQVIAANYDSLGRQTELNDPDKGHWYYVNSALGQVLQQTDARGTVTKTTYDRAGRPMTRTTQESGGPLETANWNYYDTTVDPATHRVALGGNGWIGALEQESVATSGTAIGYATAHSANSTTHYYDAKGRPHIDLNNIDGTWFYTYTDYTEPNGTDLNRVNRVQYYWRPSVGTDPGRSQILALHVLLWVKSRWYKAGGWKKASTSITASC
ncbi:MAG TPA: RHS repeat domain-containing protein, partial [Candidatus Saccharimonadales bacterium]|nr:RHS repeat domain-containing protein [Candidatus Saccharimonadales bacterium]